MTPLWAPLIRSAGAMIAGDHAVAGGWTRARAAIDIGRTDGPHAAGPVALSDLPPAARAALTAPRAPLMGFDWQRPLVMAILNVTPDSFSDGGQFADTDVAIAQARRLIDAGADILDIGGESTRPGAVDVSVDAEIARTVPVIAALRAAGVTTPLSIDTRKAAVARAALAAGASMVNDVSALTHDPDMGRVVAQAGAPVCLMHAQGSPQTMQDDPRYSHVTRDVITVLAARIEAALAAGIARHDIIVDPGIGFGKTMAHNLMLLRHLSAFHSLGAPVLLGASRKRFIGTIGGGRAGETPPGERLPGSLAVALHAAAQGMQILRVHDMLATKQALALHMAIGAPGA